VEKDEPGGREHAHKLLEWLEWLTNIKFDIHTIDVDEICGEGSEMVRVVPLPRRSLVFCKNTSWQMNDSNSLLGSSNVEPRQDLQYSAL